MRFIRSVPACILAALLFHSCNNDLKLIAPYKEIPSVYALLNPSESRHWIRINKVFLGEGDANVMATIADSANYPAGELSVTLTRYLNDAKVAASKDGDMTIVFRDTMVQNKLQPGAFNRDQRLWYSDEKLYESGEYRLEIYNSRTGNTFKAKANSISAIKAAYPPLTPPYYPYNPNTSPEEYIDYSQRDGIVRFIPNEAELYQVVIRTHYFDSIVVPTQYKTYDYIDYNFGTREERTKTMQGNNSYIIVNFRQADYFNAAGLELDKKNPPEAVWGRRIYKIEYIVHSSTQEYIDFLQYNAPSFAITQTTPLYSNFENRDAIGIFTFRNTFSVEKQPANPMINEFARNPNTCNYRFFDANRVVGNCPQ